MDHIGLDDTSASEPLWSDDAGEAPASAVAPEPAATSQETVLMEAVAEGPSGVEFAADGRLEADADATVMADFSQEAAAFRHAQRASEEDASSDGRVEDGEPNEAPAKHAMAPVDDDDSADEGEVSLQHDERRVAPTTGAHNDAEEDARQGVADATREAPREKAANEERVVERGGRAVDDAQERQTSDAADRAAKTSMPSFLSRQARATESRMPARTREVPTYRRTTDTWERNQRPSSRRGTGHAVLPMALVAAVAAATILFGFLVAFILLGRGGTDETKTADTPIVTSKHVSKREAENVIASLDGWWATDRTFDGRHWFVEDGIMQTFAADGNIAREQQMDPDSVERMSEGPGGIEGAGYYLRDIAFFLSDADPDTLYAINSDGSADEDANLFRTEDPKYGEEPEVPVYELEEEEEDPNAADFILPESSKRLYTTEELEPLSEYDLYVAYNELYARHGYVFKSGGDLEARFTAMSWYQPNPNASWNDLTDIEKQNASTIKALQQARGSIYA